MARASTKSAKADPTPPLIAPPTHPGLSDLLGQSRAVAALRSAMGADRVHHAWIFHGPPGVGKFTAAHAFARELLDPADGSPISQQARSGSHPDLHVIRKEMAAISREARIRSAKQTNIPLDVLREFLIEPAAMAAWSASSSRATKVFIVDEADLIAPEGQNALLKTLEEPPPGSVIILVTSALERLLVTVRSRCQPVGFAPLDDASMSAWFERRDAPPPPKGEREWLVWFAEGSPGLAALAMEHGLHAWHVALEPLLAAAERGLYSPGLGPAMAKLIDEHAAAAQKANPDASKEAANRAWSRRMFMYLARRLRDRLRGQGPSIGPALRGLEACQDAERAVHANVRCADVMENLSVRFATSAHA